jgi:hypothetical protein
MGRGSGRTAATSREQRNGLVVKRLAGGGDDIAAAKVACPRPIADHPARAAHHRDEGIIVVALEPAFDDEVEIAGGQPGIAQRVAS